MKEYILQCSIVFLLTFTVFWKYIPAFAEGGEIRSVKMSKSEQFTKFQENEGSRNFSESEIAIFLNVLSFLQKELETEQEKNIFEKVCMTIFMKFIFTRIINL